MQSISHGTPSGGEVTISFTGDLFEMEDQRNWTDASYKTYSTPLRIPYPAPIAQRRTRAAECHHCGPWWAAAAVDEGDSAVTVTD